VRFILVFLVGLLLLSPRQSHAMHLRVRHHIVLSAIKSRFDARAAADTVTMAERDFVAAVLRENPALRALRYEIPVAAADVTTARLRPNPFANITADILPVPGEKFAPASGQYGVSVQLPIERGDKRARRSETAEAAVRAVSESIADAERQVILTARQAWIDLLSARASLAIADQTLASYDQLVELNRSRLSAKQIAGAELSRSIVARSQAAIQRDEAALSLRQARALLGALLGRTIEIAPRDTLTATLQPVAPLDSLLARARTTRADARAARTGAQVALANRRLQEANATQDITVGVDASVQQFARLYGVSGSIPFAMFNRNQGEREKAVAREAQAAQRIRAVDAAIEVDLRSAYAEFETRRASLARFTDPSRESIMAEALSIKAAAEFAYRNGSTSLLELLDAERTYTDLYRAYIDSVARYQKSLALVDAAAGLSPLDAQP
jgi:outer membrane protein, heavy metal efflux system